MALPMISHWFVSLTIGTPTVDLLPICRSDAMWRLYLQIHPLTLKEHSQILLSLWRSYTSSIMIKSLNIIFVDGILVYVQLASKHIDARICPHSQTHDFHGTSLVQGHSCFLARQYKPWNGVPQMHRKALVSMDIPTKYGHMWYSTSILGSRSIPIAFMGITMD